MRPKFTMGTYKGLACACGCDIRSTKTDKCLRCTNATRPQLVSSNSDYSSNPGFTELRRKVQERQELREVAKQTTGYDFGGE